MELLWVPILSHLILVENSWTHPINEGSTLRPEDVELAEDYLQKFYSLPPTDADPSSPVRKMRSVFTMEDKLREMQNFFGLLETGTLNNATLEIMRLPRCGVPDVENYSFYPSRPKWKNHSLTYTISKYTPDMTREEVEKAFRAALKMWSDVTPLRFTQVGNGNADIIFTFARRTHGDFFPFDGPRGVLAHAFQPGEGLGGDVHFDEDETWTAGGQGYNLFAVAAHELGHSLGLTHSKDPSAIMYPTYRHHSNTQHTLSADDILGIQTLYGKSSKKAETRPAASKKCEPGFSFDAAAMVESKIVLMKNRHIWLRTTENTYWNQLTEGQISTYLPGISGQVDAAYDIPARGEAYIFTGQKYWVVRQLSSKSHPSSISDYGFPSGVTRIDAAVHVSEYGKTIFFTGESYYRFDEVSRQMDPGFPRLIQKDWRGIPKHIDAAFKMNGNIFLLSGEKSYQYDFKQKRVMKVILGNSWLGC